MITTKEIMEHRETHGLSDFVQDMGLEEYAAALDKDAVVMIDPHGFIVDSLTGMALAADGEQLDLLIAHLEKMRKYMLKKNMRDSVSSRRV